jgi:hypothetical protein
MVFGVVCDGLAHDVVFIGRAARLFALDGKERSKLPLSLAGCLAFPVALVPRVQTLRHEAGDFRAVFTAGFAAYREHGRDGRGGSGRRIVQATRERIGNLDFHA